jgi:hypothetical protein
MRQVGSLSAESGQTRAVADYRFLESLFSGRFFDKPLGSVEKPTNRAGN